MSLTLANGSRFLLADLTGDIANIPNTYGYVNQLDLFRSVPTSQTSVLLDITDYGISLLDPVDRDTRNAESSAPESLRQVAFPLIYFKHIESITPEQVQGIRQAGTAAELTTEAMVRARKLQKIRMTHDITKEFLLMQALKGKVVDSKGFLWADMYQTFGVEKKTVYFDLDNPDADIDGAIDELVEHMEDTANTGGLTNGEQIIILVDRAFFRKLTGHAKVREAYMAQQAVSSYGLITGSLKTGRSDGVATATNEFPYRGVVFRQYNGKFTDKRNTVHKLVGISGVEDSVGVGHAFPNTAMLGEANDLYQISYGPANKMGYVNTLGQDLYVFEYAKDRDEGTDFEAHSYMMPICTRPQLLVDVRADKAS